MTPRSLTLPLAAGLLAVVAGCATPAANQETAPTQPAPSSAVPAIPYTSPAPIPGLRPLTPAQRQRRDLCQQGTVKNGCEFYSDDSLRLQGIDPNADPGPVATRTTP
jgi:hypothetical protein